MYLRSYNSAKLVNIAVIIITNNARNIILKNASVISYGISSKGSSYKYGTKLYNIINGMRYEIREKTIFLCKISSILVLLFIIRLETILFRIKRNIK